MFGVILTVLRTLGAAFQPRRQLLLENLALRHQLLVLNRTAVKPTFSNPDRLLWIFLRAAWSRWKGALVIIRTQTVIGWHRAGFRLYWRWKSRSQDGRPPFDRELFGLVHRMWEANPMSGGPRIRDELAKLGLQVFDSTIRKYRPPKAPRSSSQSWKTFLSNHTEEIVAIDFSLSLPRRSECCPCSSFWLTNAGRWCTSPSPMAPSAFWTA
jgi:hypothetical protein